MSPIRSNALGWLTLCALLVVATRSMAADGEHANSPPDLETRICELGITHALAGDDAAAESVFVALLSRSPGDARAWNNLGNLHLRHGDPAVALAFYARAAQADSADAGITLNEAAALMIEGDHDAAQNRADVGVKRAGGPEQAARLLGLRYTTPDEGEARGADRSHITRDEVLALLRAAARAIPADSATAAREAAKDAKSRKPPSAWRPAGARGAADTDVAAVLYWKR